MTSKCFICSLPAYMFEYHGGFQKHIREDHNMWMYLYYTVYLKSISTADRTDHQAYLYEQWVHNQNPAPFPIKRAQVLEAANVNESSDLAVGIMKKVSGVLAKSSAETQDQLSEMNTSLRDRMEEMKKKLAAIEKDIDEKGQDARKGQAQRDPGPTAAHIHSIEEEPLSRGPSSSNIGAMHEDSLAAISEVTQGGLDALAI